MTTGCRDRTSCHRCIFCPATGQLSRDRGRGRGVAKRGANLQRLVASVQFGLSSDLASNLIDQKNASSNNNEEEEVSRQQNIKCELVHKVAEREEGGGRDCAWAWKGGGSRKTWQNAPYLLALFGMSQGKRRR